VEKDNQVYFQANRECAVFNEIRSIVVKTAGLGDVLRSALEGLGDAINLAFVYGSMARGNDRAGSDVDLLVVGDAEYKKVNSELVQAQKILGREINPTVFPPEEFRKKAKAGSHFLSTVLKDKKIFIKGNEHELARLAE
jgi:predicted nucleotidyltransferase